jgi:hypothetical protein
VSSVDFSLRLRRADVRYFLGYPEDHEPPFQTRVVLDNVVEEARMLVSARGVFCQVDAASAVDIGLEPRDAEALFIGLVTIGPAVERRASEYQRQGQITAALVMDAAGSAAVEEAADRLSAIAVGGEPSDAEPESVPCRVSPGYGDWAIESQRQLFEILPARDLDVELTPTCLMVPRKSVSFAIWLGANEQIRGGCTACKLERCSYRRSVDND